MLLSYKPLHLEAQQRLEEEGCVVDITAMEHFPLLHVLVWVLLHQRLAPGIVVVEHALQQVQEPERQQKIMIFLCNLIQSQNFLYGR